MAHKEFDFEEQQEIDSVSSLISKIKKLREQNQGMSTELYFRGQEVEFWDIEPSIFRNDMLSIEHKLMQIPLQKIPMEFKGLNSMFDIMTKYQHYGMCTRLLDLTTNPLVALYFACKIHGKEEYDTDEEIIEKEPYGIIYYTSHYYPTLSTDKDVQIISALSGYDLSSDNTIIGILERLKDDQIIDDKTKERWLKKENFREFVNIIQQNYMVTPTYTNERLRKQNGMFFLASLFSVDESTNVGNSIITKSKGDLRKEFSDNFFYIRGENKEDILDELNLYNINEATLFPELEHQLNYICHTNRGHVQPVSDFFEYEERDVTNVPLSNFNDEKLNTFLLDNLQEFLRDTIASEDLEEIQKIIQNNLSIDWYKRDTVLSKMKMSITGYFFVRSQDRESSKKKADEVLSLIREEVQKYIASSTEGGE